MDSAASPTNSRRFIDLTNNASRLKLSVVMPVHNEEPTIEAAVADVLDMKLGHPFELVIVDDGSTDGTAELLSFIDDPRVVVHQHRTKRGKGAAVLSGAALTTGSHLVIFDADREYRAADLVRLFEPIVDERAEIVFGVRVFGMNTVYRSYRHALGNRVTTFVANVLFDAYISDLHSCLKMVPVDLFRSLSLREPGFGLDSELTAELLRRGYRPYEIPVSYIGRSHAQGKKLTWRDGVGCLAVLSRVRTRGRPADGEAKRAPAEIDQRDTDDIRNVVSFRARRARPLRAPGMAPQEQRSREVISESLSE